MIVSCLFHWYNFLTSCECLLMSLLRNNKLTPSYTITESDLIIQTSRTNSNSHIKIIQTSRTNGNIHIKIIQTSRANGNIHIKIMQTSRTNSNSHIKNIQTSRTNGNIHIKIIQTSRANGNIHIKNNSFNSVLNIFVFIQKHS